jgi:hypothetical protein
MERFILNPITQAIILGTGMVIASLDISPTSVYSQETTGEQQICRYQGTPAIPQKCATLGATYPALHRATVTIYVTHSHRPKNAASQ